MNLTFIVGDEKSGKKATQRTLCNYAIKNGWNSLVIDTNVSQNNGLVIVKKYSDYIGFEQN